MTLGRKLQQLTGNAGEARKVYASQSKVGTLSGCSSSISLCDMIEPPDWEELSERLLSERDPLAYPANDVELITVPRKLRTLAPVLPDEPLDKASMFVRECIHSYTSSFTMVEYKFRSQSGSACGRERRAERLERLQCIPRHQYEVDVDPLTISMEELSSQQIQFESQPSSGRQSVASMSSSSSCNETLTPRGSWASLDLRSSSSDPLLTDLLERRPPEQLDAINEARRLENRQADLLGLYSPYLDDEEAVERRLPAEMPCEVMGHRILVLCHQLKLELDVEPMFASMALYDAKEKKKLSENFYFNLNSECTRQMLSSHLSHADLSTLSRSAVFDILNPSPDVFLVVRLEKVLQGDINECVEPYIKDDKNREKVRASAQAACARLGKYRMPFAWTAVCLATVLAGTDANDAGTPSSTASNSLDRKCSSSSLEQLRRRAGEVGGSLTRKGSERRLVIPEPDDIAAHLENIKPVAVTLTSIFKQEVDKLRDEDLYKFLQEIKRPSSAPKKLKCIPGTLKIEICPCPEEIRNALTPELAKLNPYGDDNVRPCKEILPFPLSPPLVPHYQYRSLLYVFPKEVNLAAYTSRTGSARNISVRIQLMAGEQQSCALPAIFGRSSCPEFTTEAHTSVLYHNKNPSLYDEIKMKLPADLGDQHHLLFTFLHISCQRKPVAPEQEKNLETIVGYSWLPLCRNGKLTCGEFSLPVMQEEPPANYSYIFPDVLLPGTRWIDNHKPIFTLTLDAHSTVHPLDSNIERFALACEAVQEGNIPARIGVANMESELRTSIHELPNANVEVLARYLPIVLDKTLQLLTAPPYLLGQPLNIAQDAFTCLAQIFTDIANMNEGCDCHGRSALLGTYIHYQASIPRPALTDRDVGLPLPPSVMTDGSCKILHEELALQWVVASGVTRDLAMHNSWALFELMVKSMVEYLYWSGAHDSPRKSRFPEQYTDDVTTLVNNVTSEIISRYGKNSRLTQGLNNSLAFFLFDLLSIMDRGFVFGLIRTYYKQMSAKIASLPDAVPLVHYKLAFLRIISSHEHYVPLSLPPLPPSGAASPSPSHSGGLSASGGPVGGLTADFRHTHYPAGLLLSELSADLDIQSPVLQCAAVSAVLALLTAHDADCRLSAPDVKARVAALYLPLVHIVLDAYPQLYRGFHDNKDILQLDGEFNNMGQPYSSVSPDGEYKQNVRAAFNSETSRNLLMCLVWVLKWAERSSLTQLLAEMSTARILTLLQTIDLCYKCQEYKGRKEIMKCAQQNVRKTTDIKSKLEDVILGQGSARSELIMRRKGCTNMSGCKRERWRKDLVRGFGTASAMTSRDSGPQPDLEAALSAEVSLTLLHALELVTKTCMNSESGQSVCGVVLQVLLRAIQRNQSATVLQHMFATLRSLILKLGWSCGGSEAAVCRVLLAHCAAHGPHARPHAHATLYSLMRHHYTSGNNFSRVKMQVTMSLSSLVGTSTTFSEESLRRSLKTILLYAEQDTEFQDTSFPEQVKDLVFNLHMILSDTVKMKEFQEDPEMLLDLMHRIARGYQNSPDLRLTWLNNMAQKHMERSNHTEAGMCLVHGAALVAEQICISGKGAAILEHVTHNALDESRGDCLHHPHLTSRELQALLEHAAGELMAAGMYETVNEVYKVLIPIAEQHRDYKKLANIHSKLHEAFSRIEQLHGKRVFGTYFRVGFYGARFGDLHAEEFVYKEHALTKLPEIFGRLQNFYGQRFGPENVVIIKDSNTVDVSTLDPDKAYIQITYVEPYFEAYELRHRVTHFERNYNIKRFMYATPFTLDGRAHGDLTEQCKRKTILTTAHHFPYLKTRIQVVQRSQIILSPIEVAIEDIQKKIAELAAATSQEPADPKMLQMVAQGCIGTTVNQGPLELAQVFLGPVADGSTPPTRLTNKLRLAFKDFSKKCQDALKKNKNLIGCDQRDYQRELERNYAKLTERLAPLLHHAPLSNGVKNEFKYQN